VKIWVGEWIAKIALKPSLFCHQMAHSSTLETSRVELSV
jgi:hypothetical protein